MLPSTSATDFLHEHTEFAQLPVAWLSPRSVAARPLGLPRPPSTPCGVFGAGSSAVDAARGASVRPVVPPGGQVIHHPAAALSTTCGADGGPLTLSVSCDPSPGHPPRSLPSSRAPTRGLSANQSAFPHRGPSFRFPVRGPARVGLSVSPPGQEEGPGRRLFAPPRSRALGLDRRVHAFACAASAGRRSMASAIESDSEHDRGASRTPTTTRTVARLRRSTARCPPRRARLSVGGPLPCGASQSDSNGTGAGVHAADRHACDRSHTRLLPRPTGVRTPPVATPRYLGSLPERDREPRQGIRRYRLPPEDRFVCLPAKENRLRLPEVPSIQGYSVRSRETWCDPRTSALLLPRRAIAFDDNQLARGPGEPSA